ncbi:hypothetical protein Hte_002313 [Hypoxylon texense]
MVGIARSKRCQRCKRIKIKCDEKWPTCTPCVRAKVQCSGPPAVTTTFINNSRQADVETAIRNKVAARSSVADRPAGSLEKIRCQDLPGGASFSHFRLHSSEPKKNLTTVADRVAARLVGYLGNDDAPWDYLVYTGYIRHLPVRLSRSAALRDCVVLMTSTWANHKRNLPIEQVMDSGLYGKALRSLQRAIDDHRERLSCETLAAVTILERVELLFDHRRPHHRARHTIGIQDLMVKRGPPELEDHLDVHLALENHATLIYHWIQEGGNNFFFISSAWKQAVQRMQSILVGSVSRERMDNYAIGYWYGYWPELVHEFRSISIDPDTHSQQEKARALRDKVIDLEFKIKAVGEPITERYLRTGLIVEQLDPDTLVGKKYHFESLDSMSFLLAYVMIRIVVNRILYHSKVVLGEEDALLEVEHREVCIQGWMVLPFIRGLGWVASMLYITPLCLSYEGADDIEKEHLLDFLIRVIEYKRRNIENRQAIGVHMLNMARALTGRSLFDTTVTSQDEDELEEATEE